MNKNLDRDIEKLKDDLNHFLKDITKTLSDVNSYSQEKVQQTKTNLKKAIVDFEGKSSEAIERTNEFLKEQGEKFVENYRDTIKKRPITCTALFFAAGAVSTYLWKRKNG